MKSEIRQTGRARPQEHTPHDTGDREVHRPGDGEQIPESAESPAGDRANIESHLLFGEVAFPIWDW